MAGLSIGWQYLTGCYVATDPASRERAEWPPHPARVFMALAAAWFETGEDPEEGTALRWMEKLGDPQLVLPLTDKMNHREVVTVFVPVNGDRAKDTFPEKKSGTLQSAPTIARKKNDRTFPSVWVGDSSCFLHWPRATAIDVSIHRAALDRLCGKVTRIGHSSSLVRMWCAEVFSLPLESEIWIPDDILADWHARRVSEGTLDFLDRQFNRRGRDQHAQLSDEITRLEKAKKNVKGKGSKERKAEIDNEIGKIKDRMTSVDNRAPIRPKLGLWSGYRRRESQPSPTAQRTDFDSDLLILTQDDGPRLPSASTLIVTKALRGAVIKHSGLQPPPSWVSGHLAAGQPVRDGRQHLALLPLPFVSSDYADGHLLGVALAFPRWVSRQERGRILGRMLLEPSGESKPIKLQLGALGIWTISKREWSESRLTLQPETWTDHPRGSRTWASVTPVVFDGLPKADRFRDRATWNNEVVAMIATACQRIGLPEPESIDFDSTSWHQGSPRAWPKRRQLRGQPEMSDATATLGDGFPPYPVKPTTGIRPQYHVWLRFAEPVIGPIVLGAGRFLGYGLCKPLSGGSRR